MGEASSPFGDEDKAEALKTYIEDYETVLPIGVKLKKQDIYAMGPAALGPVLFRHETAAAAINPYMALRKPEQYMIRIAAFAPRDEKLAEQLALTTKRTGSSVPVLEHEPVRIECAEEYGEDQYPLAVDSDPGFKFQEKGLLQVRMKKILADVFATLRFVETRFGERVRFTFTRAQIHDKTGGINVSFFPGFKAQIANLIVDRINKEGIGEVAHALIGGGRWSQVIVESSITKTGKVSIPEMSIQMVSKARTQRTR